MQRDTSRFVLTLAIGLCYGHASAQLEFSISPSPVGSGARAAGMSNAFLAIADDATAASWNPAGLVQLERPEISIVGAFNLSTDEFNATDRPEFESRHATPSGDLNFLSFTYPIPFTLGNRNATVSIAYQKKFDFTRDFGVDLLTLDPNDPGFRSTARFNFDQNGGLSAITPAIAVELTKRLSVGVALNLWRSSFLADNGWTQTVTVDAEASSSGVILTSSHRTTTDEYENLEGENYSVGVLWAVTNRWNLGFRFDSAFKADVDFKTTTVGTNTIPPVFTAQESRQVKFPHTISAGIAYRRNDRLTIALDASRTDWNDFYIQTEDGGRFSLVDGQDINDPSVATDFDPAYTVRLGAEYVFIPKRPDLPPPRFWSLRGGLLFDQEPASGRPTVDPVVPGDGRPDSFYGFAVGVGLQALQRLNFDLAYQFRYGPGVNSDRLRGVAGFEEDVLQHRLLFSMVMYF